MLFLKREVNRHSKTDGKTGENARVYLEVQNIPLRLLWNYAFQQMQIH